MRVKMFPTTRAQDRDGILGASREIRLAIEKRKRSAGSSSLGFSDKSNDTPEGRNPPPYGRNICIGEILTLRLGARSYRSVVQFWDHLSRDYPGSRLREGFYRERDPCTSTNPPPPTFSSGQQFSSPVNPRSAAFTIN